MKSKFVFIILAIVGIFAFGAEDALATQWLYWVGGFGSTPEVREKIDDGAWTNITPAGWTSGTIWDGTMGSDGALYIGGWNYAPGYQRGDVFQYSGGSWTLVSPTGLLTRWESVYVLDTASDGKILIGGENGGSGATAYYDDTGWHNLGTPPASVKVTGIVANVATTTLYAAWDGGVDDDNITPWTPSGWGTSLDPAEFEEIHDLVLDSSGNLYAAGRDDPYDALVQVYDGSDWEDISPGLGIRNVEDLWYDAERDVIYATGYLTGGYGVVIRWDGSSWTDITPTDVTYGRIGGVTTLSRDMAGHNTIYIAGVSSDGETGLFSYSITGGTAWITTTTGSGLNGSSAAAAAHAPELPPHALQALILAFGSILTYIKRRWE